MRRAVAMVSLIALAPAMSGCASMRQFQDRVAAKKAALRANAASAATAGPSVAGDTVRMTTLKELPPPDGSVPVTAIAPAQGNAPAAAAPYPAATAGGVPPGMQFLYGSGEAAALDMQAYFGLVDLMIAKSSDRGVGQPVASVVLTPQATLAAPKYVSCGDKPLAVVFDIDETALLNLGYEANDAQHPAPFDPARWDAWEKTGAKAVAAVPGMIEVARVAKASNVTLVFNSNRAAANAAETAAALDGAGLGPAVHGTNLWLEGDAGSGGGKDARRAAIAAKYCVIAMAGDQLGDFSDLFNAPGLSVPQRRTLTETPAIKINWGHGWFVLPNPIYGTAIKGGLDEVFPPGRRWSPPAAASPAARP